MAAFFTLFFRYWPDCPFLCISFLIQKNTMILESKPFSLVRTKVGYKFKKSLSQISEPFSHIYAEDYLLQSPLIHRKSLRS